MNLSLANPALLPLTVLVAAPVLIHLFARSRPKSMPFSSIRFIEEIVRKTSRIQQPRSWLILLLRTLFFAAIIGIVLKPLLMAPNPLSGDMERKNVVIIIDSSASMAAVEGSRTRFAAACARASEIISGLASGDLANIIWMRGSSAAEFPTLAANKEALQQALQAARVSLEPADLPGAFNRAEALLRGTKGAREIHVLSDFQTANWKEFPVPTIPEARLVLIQAGSKDVPNQALLEIVPSSLRILAGEDAEFTCRVANYSGQPVLRSIFLRSGEITQTRDIRLQPWSEGSVTFSCRFAKPGEQPVEFTLDEDDFPFDNSRRIVLDVRPNLTVGIAGSDTETARLWSRALESIDWIRVTAVNPAGPIDCEVLLLAGWDGGDIAPLQAFLKAGGSIICSPAPGLSLKAVDTVIGRDRGTAEGIFENARLSEPEAMRIANTGHPAFAIFANGESGNPAGGRFSQRLGLSGSEWPGDGILLAYRDGTPALAEWGRFILWNINLAKSEPKWAERVEFVPFLAELILASRRGTASGAVGDFPAGAKIVREFPHDTLDEEVTIIAPTGELPAERTASGSMSFASKTPLTPGLYEWLTRGSSAGFAAVNFPALESDLRVSESPAAATPGATSLTVGESVTALREGIPLWPWLLALACLCILAESLVVWKTRPATA
jgi:hypothetical protein